VTLVSLGARRKFHLAGRPAEFRILASNLTGVEGYWVARSGIFSPIPPRTARALLTVTFGPSSSGGTATR
jgi:iron complex outermembrane receptor protein